MLSEEERQEIEEVLSQYGGDAQAASVESLKALQRRRGWVSDATLADLAAFLRLATEDLEAVATFYNLIFRSPVGRHVILVCDSVSCWLMGYEQVSARLCERLGVGFGDTTPDGRFTLLPTVCLGDCDHAPVMMVNDDLHRELEPETAAAILDRYR
ncbi:MAG: NADH-quinone oxidoreductase subunit NuoE [Geminicoccaceae bacterium]